MRIMWIGLWCYWEGVGDGDVCWGVCVCVGVCGGCVVIVCVIGGCGVWCVCVCGCGGGGDDCI